MDKLDGKTLDIEEMNIHKIKELFPNVVTEGKIDFEKLKIILGDEIDDSTEKYQFTWNGKKQTIKLAQTPSTGTLRPSKKDSKNWDTTENLYIEGDNLEVLKLLQKTYYGKIKMIYIDPPYNTGGDFVYKDDFKDNIKNYKEQTNQNLRANPETSGRYHTDWLNMMYSRLMLARNLLSDDGVIFISIDDNEMNRLSIMCDEILGETNFIANICHKARGSISNDKIISANHNTILLYAKNYDSMHRYRKSIGAKPVEEGFNKIDEKGKYKLVPVDGPGGAAKGNPHYEFMGVEGFWRFSKSTMQDKYNKGLVVKTEKGLQQKYYLDDAIKTRRTLTTWWEKGYLTSSATTNLKKLIGGKFFDNPKNVNLIMQMLEMFLHEKTDSLILDFFSGSSTTAHAVMKLNAEDGGNRKFIMVQLPEKTEEKSEAYKAGYKNICEIGKERIRRSGEQVKSELSEKKSKAGILTNEVVDPDSLDIGFKVFKLDSTNIKPWDGTARLDEDTILDKLEVIKDDRSKQDILYEIMIKFGVLDMPVEELEVNGKPLFSVGKGHLLVFIENDIQLDDVKTIAELKPHSVIFLESGFNNDGDKMNALYTLERLGIKEVKSI